MTWWRAACVWSGREVLPTLHLRMRSARERMAMRSIPRGGRLGSGLMAREQRIVATFVEFADTLVADFDVVEFLHRVAERCVELLDCIETGVLIADPAGTL